MLTQSRYSASQLEFMDIAIISEVKKKKIKIILPY